MIGNGEAGVKTTHALHAEIWLSEGIRHKCNGFIVDTKRLKNSSFGCR